MAAAPGPDGANVGGHQYVDEPTSHAFSAMDHPVDLQKNRGGGRVQAAKVCAGMWRLRCRLRRHSRRLGTAARTGLSNVSSVGMLADSTRALPSGSGPRWPCRSVNPIK